MLQAKKTWPPKWRRLLTVIRGSETLQLRDLERRLPDGDLLDDLKERLNQGSVTFVYAARDEEHNSALVLKEYLERGS